MIGHSEQVSFIWSIAELLRGDYKQSDYGKVILPFTVLRRLDCVLGPTKDAVLKKLKSTPEDAADPALRERILNKAAGYNFHNISPYNFPKLLSEPENMAANLKNYIQGFSGNIRNIFLERFDLLTQIARLDNANLLYLIVTRFSEIDLHPNKVSNHAMGTIFEELIRRFSEQSNETAGEHFTPREVIRLMVDVLFYEDSKALADGAPIRAIYDPACGTGGMLSVAADYLQDANPDIHVQLFGQELNPEAHGICQSDMLIKNQNPDNIVFGNSFTEDGHADRQFDYMLSNPPFGVEWKKIEKEIRNEHDKMGTAGRFGAGLPRISDGSLLFVQHMISKFRKDGGTSRLAVVLNGSPLFSGGAGSGESEIRRWIIENDMLEAIIGMPDQLFYNTGIFTYIWIITNKKEAKRKGKIQLINATGFFQKMRKSLGNKRNELSPEHIEGIARIFGDFQESEHSKIFDNADFGYQRITVERPLKLNFRITKERIDALKEQNGFHKLASSRKKGAAAEEEIEQGKKIQDAILKALQKSVTDKTWDDRDTFSKHLKSALKPVKEDVSASLFKTILMGLSERDENAEPCMKGKNPEPDPELRDYENVPLKEDIQEYFDREVYPHAPDSWIDHDKTRIGYEVSFTRHFYKYEPPRPLEEIDRELKDLSREIQGMLEEVIAA